MKTEKITQTIQAENIREHELELRHKLTLLQLHFAEIKHLQALEREKDIRFSDAVNRYTDLINGLRSLFTLAYEKADKTDVHTFTEARLTKVDQLYNRKSEDWMEKIINYLEAELKLLEDKADLSRRAESTDRIGPLKYNIGRGYEQMAGYGINPEDECLEIHFDNVYQHEGGKVSAGELRRNLSHVAELIIKDHPYVKAVIGRSWLMSHPIAQRIGFIPIEDVDVPQNYMDTWSQFIDKDGQINQARFERMVQTGEIPLKSKFGYFDIRSFLNKYLPEKYRGREIKLKTIRPEWKDEYNKIMRSSDRLKSDWGSIGPGHLNEYFDKNTALKEYLRNAGVWEDWIRIMNQLKDTGCSWENVQREFEKYPDLRQQADKYYRKNKYDEITVVIE